MIKFLAMELFILFGGAAGVFYYLNKKKKREVKQVSVDARFIGGPLDGQTRELPVANAIYLYQNRVLPGDALYKKDSVSLYDNVPIYTFDEYVDKS